MMNGFIALAAAAGLTVAGYVYGYISAINTCILIKGDTAESSSYQGFQGYVR